MSECESNKELSLSQFSIEKLWGTAILRTTKAMSCTAAKDKVIQKHNF